MIDPENYEASWVKACLLDPTILVRFPLTDEDFSSKYHKQAFSILKDLFESDGIEYGRFWSAWKKAGHRISDYQERLDKSWMDPESAYNGIDYARKRRDFIAFATEFQQRCHDPLESLDDLRAWALAQISQHGTESGITTVGAVMDKAAQKARLASEGKAARIETGFVLLDRLIGGWEEDKLYCVGARPKAGKTALACQTAWYAAECGHRVYFASREMGETQIGTRFLSQVGMIDNNAIRHGKHTGDLSKIVDKGKARGNDFLIDCRPSLSWERLRASILQCHAQKRLNLVLLDYLQLVNIAYKLENRAAELEKISYGMKELAKELNAPVVVLSQLNRDQEDSKAPSSNKLKGSGGIEQAVDCSILLWRPNEKDLRTVEIIVDLNRDGPTGRFKASFLPEFTCFE